MCRPALAFYCCFYYLRQSQIQFHTFERYPMHRISCLWTIFMKHSQEWCCTWTGGISASYFKLFWWANTVLYEFDVFFCGCVFFLFLQHSCQWVNLRCWDFHIQGRCQIITAKGDGSVKTQRALKLVSIFMQNRYRISQYLVSTI